MKHAFLCALAALAFVAPALADDGPGFTRPPQSTIRSAPPPQAPPVAQVPAQAPPVAKVSYAAGYHEALKSGKTLLTAVSCPCPDVAGCVCCEAATLEGFAPGVHVSVVSNGKLQYVGVLGQTARTATMAGGFQGGDCAAGQCGPTGSAGFGYGGYGTGVMYSSGNGGAGGSCASGSCGSSSAATSRGIFRRR